MLEEARLNLQRINSALSREEVAPTHNVVLQIRNFISNDLNIEGAINAVLEWCKETEAGARGGSAGELSRALDLYLGIAL